MATVTVEVKLRGGERTASLAHGRTTVADLRASLLADLSSEVTPPHSTPLLADCLLLFDDATGVELADSTVLAAATGPVAAFEVFFATPAPLYRTVLPSQVHPAVMSDNPNALSQVAPLMCSALEQSTEALSPAFFGRDGVTHVRGMSLCSELSSTPGVHPTTPVSAGELRGLTAFDAAAMAPASAPFLHLHTSDLFGGPPRSVFRMNEVSRNKSPKGTVGRHSEVTKRTIFFCFELPTSTALQPLGAAVVFDNRDSNTPGHFTLIPWPLAALTDTPCWQAAVDEPHILVRDPAALAPSHPESFLEQIGGDGFFTLPFVAAKFRLHNIVMNASGNPFEDDMSTFKDGDNVFERELVRACQMLTAHSGRLREPLSALLALNALIESKYSLGDLAKSNIIVIRAAFEEVSLKIILSREEADVLANVQESIATYLAPQDLVVFGVTLPSGASSVSDESAPTGVGTGGFQSI